MRLFEFKTPIFEINFNDPKLAKSVLKMPIQCGFEAESVWTRVSNQPEYDEDYLVDVNWDDDLIQDNISSRIHNRVQQAYSDWIRETQLDDYLNDAVDWWIRNNRDDYYDEFIDSENLEEEFEEWSRENENDDRSEFVDDNYSNRYNDWLSENAIEFSGDDIYDRAIERAERDLDIDEYARQEFGSVYRMLADEHSEYLEDYLGGSGGGLEAVGEEIESWAKYNSYSSTVKTGEYHSSGRGFSDWGVEKDSSIEADEYQGAEIISPVYDTPEQMLKEMKSLFDYFEKNGVETNRTTGLHVTMSWSEKEDVGKENKLKMALLLGDQYLLKQFGRESNTYTTSQVAAIKQYATNLTKDLSDAKSLKKLEELLRHGVSGDKYRSIHFKHNTNDVGNRLIEFRIAGGEDYHTQFDKVVKSVVRYATIMQAGHTDAYQKDYIQTLLRLVNSSMNVDYDLTKDVEKKLSAPELKDIKQKPIVSVIQNFASPARYSSIIDTLLSAYENLMLANTGQKELFEQDEDSAIEPWQQRLSDAQRLFANVVSGLAADIVSKTNRAPINVQMIQALRNTMREFKLDYTTLWSLIKQSKMYDSLISDEDSGGPDNVHQAINQLVKANMAKTEPPQFTIQYSPNESVWIPKAVYDLLDSNTPPRLTANIFKVIPNIEYDKAHQSQRELLDVENILASRKTKLANYKRMGIPPEETKDLETGIQYAEEERKKLLDFTTQFKQKYGFLPPKSRYSDEGAEGEKQELLTRYELQKIGRKYNIEFKLV